MSIKSQILNLQLTHQADFAKAGSRFTLAIKDYFPIKEVLNRTILLKNSDVYIYPGIKTGNRDNATHGIMCNVDDQYISFGLPIDPTNIKTCYKLTNTFAGGRFLIHKDNTVEYTIYGSGLPIIKSYLGRLEHIRPIKN